MDGWETNDGMKEPGADLGLLVGGSQSIVVICRLTYELGGRHM